MGGTKAGFDGAMKALMSNIMNGDKPAVLAKSKVESDEVAAAAPVPCPFFCCRRYKMRMTMAAILVHVAGDPKTCDTIPVMGCRLAKYHNSRRKA